VPDRNTAKDNEKVAGLNSQREAEVVAAERIETVEIVRLGIRFVYENRKENARTVRQVVFHTPLKFHLDVHCCEGDFETS